MSDEFSTGRQVRVYHAEDTVSRNFRRGVDSLLAILRDKSNQATSAKEVVDIVLESLHQRGYRVPRIWAKERSNYRLIAANDFPASLIETEPRFDINNPLLEQIVREHDIYDFVDVSEHKSLFTGTIDPLNYVLGRYPSAVAMAAVPYTRHSEFLIPSEISGLMVLNYDPNDPGEIEVKQEGDLTILRSRELGFLEQVSFIVADKVVRLLERNREPETGLYSRGKYRSDLDRFVGDVYLHNISCGLLLIDFDKFKSYNDQYGHLAGDQAINAFASTLRDLESREIRPYHQGGDEFGVIAFGNQQKVISLAETLLHSMPILDNLPKGASPLTLSIGMAMMGPGIKDGEEWYKRADNALYTAKSRGKNQFAVYGV